MFGYDFKSDHEALLAKDEGRVDVEVPELSLILQKPSLMIPHKGGRLIEEGGWEYTMLYRWLEAGAKPADGSSKFARLEIQPSEIVFKDDGQRTPLRVIAHWADGSREDVTCISRFQSNDDSIAAVDKDGVVTSAGTGDTHIIAFYDNGVAAVPVLRAVSDQNGSKYPDVPTPTEVDRLIVEKLRKLGIVPSGVCTDEEFLRRVSLDMTGTLPTPAEIRAFLADSDPDKRARKIDDLLARPTYAAWWTNKLCDILGNTPRNFQGQTAARDYARVWYNWMYRRIAENRPYDEMMADIVMATSRESDQDYEDYAAEMSAYFREDDPADFTDRDTMPYFWARRNIRQPEEKALAFSYAFLGVRLQCAQCHKHPFDQWTQQDFQQFQAFFEPIRYGLTPDGREMLRELQEEMGYDRKKMGNNQFRRELVKLLDQGEIIPWEEVYITQPRQPARRKGKKVKSVRGGGRVITPKILGGDSIDMTDYDDPRAPLMEWMRSPENPYFARAFVNRVWSNYFGRGIVNPPDDMNLANPPCNEPLLDYLAQGFIAHDFDMKWLHREITTSDAYQRSWRTNPTNEHDERNFSRAIIRRLPAEVILDAITQATAGSEALTVVAEDIASRSFGPQGTVSYGRGGAGYADRVFGRSSRDTNCDCSRSDAPNLLQLIYLKNDQDVLNALRRQGGWIDEQRGGPTENSRDAPSTSSMVDQMQRIEARLEKVPANAKGKALRLRYEGRLRKLRRTLQASRQDERQVETIKMDDLDTLVTEAYLRTLSRPPTAGEEAIAREHFASTDDDQAALRDLLWALLNTKEFMTNH